VITLRHRTSGLALALVSAGVLLSPSAASANAVECEGFTAPVTPKASELDYRFVCSEEIKGFSIVSNIEVGEFSTTADVLDPTTNDPISGQAFNCEGPIPGDGFGCSGDALAPNRIAGKFAIDGKRCVAGRNQLRAWVVAVDAAGTSSGPFALHNAKCPKPARPAKGRKRRH
jgi:hypothetical protein